MARGQGTARPSKAGPGGELISASGLERLQQQLVELKGPRREEIADRIREARGFGDLSENAEYDAAKNDQALLEQRIASREDRIAGAVVSDDRCGADEIGYGSSVNLRELPAGASYKYRIVGPAESDPAAGLISYESPVGRALVGAQRGATIDVPLRGGRQRRFKITKIS